MQLLRRITVNGPLILALLFIMSMQVGAVSAASQKSDGAGTVQSSIAHFNPNVELLRQMVRAGRLASTVHVLDSLAPTTIVQFPLAPSGIKTAFPQATGLVTIVRGNRDNALADTITVDVQNMPPNIDR